MTEAMAEQFERRTDIDSFMFLSDVKVCALLTKQRQLNAGEFEEVDDFYKALMSVFEEIKCQAKYGSVRTNSPFQPIFTKAVELLDRTQDLIASIREDFAREKEFIDRITYKEKQEVANAMALMTPEEMTKLMEYVLNHFPSLLQETSKTDELQFVVEGINKEIYPQLKPMLAQAMERAQARPLPDHLERDPFHAFLRTSSKRAKTD